MTRPCRLRWVGFTPNVDFFKPSGVPLRALEHVTLALDEVEALRLADLNGLYQEEAAKQMKISRPTFARIVEQARKKVADAVINGKGIRIERRSPVRYSGNFRGSGAGGGGGLRRRFRGGRGWQG